MTVGPNVGVSWDSPSENVAQVITVDSILTGVTAGLTLQNTTAATVGAQVQRSPSLWQYGRGWDVDDAVSRVFGMGWQMRPVAGNTVTGALHLMRDLDGVVADVGLSLTSAGAFILPHSYGALVRLTEDDADVRDGLAWNATNTLVLGNVALGRVQLSPDTGELYAGSTFVMRWVAAGISMRVSPFEWDNSASLLPLIRQLNVNSANPFTVRAAGAASGTNNGARLRLQGGRRQSTGFRGSVCMQWNADDSTFESGVETANVVADNRVVALCFGSDLTSTQMPASTGDRVIFLANAATAPTASAVGGGILYASAGALRWRGSSGTDTPIAAA